MSRRRRDSVDSTYGSEAESELEFEFDVVAKQHIPTRQTRSSGPLRIVHSLPPLRNNKRNKVTVDSPDQAVYSPAEAVDSPAQAVYSPAEAVDSPAQAVDSPAQAVDSPAQAVDSPAQAVDSPAQAVNSPAQAVDSPAEAADSPAETDDELSDNEYYVTGIQDMFRGADGKRYFEVNWSGYLKKHNTVEPEDNLDGCADLIRAYAETHRKADGSFSTKEMKDLFKHYQPLIDNS